MTTQHSYYRLIYVAMIFLSLVTVDVWGQHKPDVWSQHKPIITPPIKQVKLYGPGLPNRTFTFSNFELIRNSITPGSAYDVSTSTVLIPGNAFLNFNCYYATCFLDIGDNDGNVGKQAFRFMVVFLDSTGQNTTYRAINVYDSTRTNIITTSLGRTDGKACFGPGGKIYFTTYAPYNDTTKPGYLIMFDPAEITATAYSFPKGFGKPYIASAGPIPDANNPTTLIYGGTFDASQVWWFNPSDLGIRYISYTQAGKTIFPEVDPRQNYVDQIQGKGNWIYVGLNRKGIEGGAYKSVYAINIATQKKYLLFQSTMGNFNLIARKDPATNENIVMLCKWIMAWHRVPFIPTLSK